MKTLEITRKAEAQIAEINNLVDSGLASIQRAGEIVVSLLSQGYTAKLISNLSGKFSVRDIQGLERVGNRTMNPHLLSFTSPAVKYLAEAPIEIQAEVIDNGVDVVVREHGKLTQRNYKINQLNRKICKQVFDGKGKIRSIAAQKKVIVAPTPKIQNDPWCIESGCLRVNKPLWFTKSDLQAILKKL